MIDLVKLKLLAGDGGDGTISLLRERSRPKGGPDGGDGGSGGDVIIVGDEDLNTLKSFAGVKELRAEHGEKGGKNKRHGADGKDLVIRVPLGTVVWLAQENHPSLVRRKKYERPVVDFSFEDHWTDGVGEDKGGEDKGDGAKSDGAKSDGNDADGGNIENELDGNNSSANSLFRLNILMRRGDLKFNKYYRDWNGKVTGDREKKKSKLRPTDSTQEEALVKHFSRADQVLDDHQKEVVAIRLLEITRDGQRAVLCQGGLGGRGNYAFRSSTNQTPLEAEYGTFGEKKEVILELRLLADLGLVGLPNAGKSTLLSRLTKAHPKIANYPFTTLEPNLGVLVSDDGKKELVVADIPGLIEGASQGKGLGDRFLRHIQNCQSLLYVLFLEEEKVFAEDDSIGNNSTQTKAGMLLDQYLTLQQELKTHHSDLLQKPSAVALNKIDLYSKELIEAAKSVFAKEGIELLTFSGVTGEGLQEVKKQVFRLMD